MRVPLTTYRLQINADFDLFAAADLVPYLSDLGVDWMYLSPILQAEQGSDHGYDVVDHGSIDSSRGGAEGLLAVSSAARNAGMGLLIDIVPNHMGVATPRSNAWWWDLLQHGQESRYAEAFDVEWEAAEGRIRVPVLGDGDVTLTVIDGELDYEGNRYPLAPGTALEGDEPGVVHDRQHYELVNWRRADAELNYRRFFAVNSLAAVRVEAPWVFEQSHREITRWFDEGLADGLRVDHPDGLAEPGAYLDALAMATGNAYVVVEKILEGAETLPPHWQAAGTTGYDALADIDRVLVDPNGRSALTALDRELHGSQSAKSWVELIHDTKRRTADTILRSEILRVSRLVPGIDGADDALAEIAACFPVYRSYLPVGRDQLEAAMRRAITRRPDLGTALDLLWPVLSDPGHPAAVRFQQTTGMIMAKGVEDTAFYRYSRLGSLTEVGGDPAEFSITVDEFHNRQEQRLAQHPASLTTLSTHDTKRSEDVRARIDAISEVPEVWRETLGALRHRAPLGDGPLENLIWESVVGAWPLGRERFHGYAEKVAREAGASTSWTDPDAAFEGRLHAMVDAAFDDPAVTSLIEGFVDTVREAGWSNSLVAKLAQITAPGVPDVYQGSELWDGSLVDPDNRRPVDFAQRRDLLSQLDAGAIPLVDDEGAIKLLVTSRALRLRRDRPDLFSRYVPLTALGTAADHVLAFDRGGAIAIGTRLPIGLARAGGWADTTVLVPAQPVIDVLTGIQYDGGELRVVDLLHRYPVALLVDRNPE